MRAKAVLRILIADDHEMFAHGLCSLFESQGYLEVVGIASSGKQLIELTGQLKPDIVITDLFMPEVTGFEAISVINEQYPDINIVVISMTNDDYAIMDAIHAGALAYLVKNASSVEILEAIHAVNRHEFYYCKSTGPKALRLIRYRDTKTGKLQFSKDRFTIKERKILALMCKEHTSREIAERLDLSVRTVDSYKETLFRKTNARNAGGLIVFALKHHMVD